MENNTINFIMGGKLGDLIQSLITVKGICNKSNKKANLYIYDIGWEFGINNVYKELYSIITQQLYINSFEILTDYELDVIQTPTQNSLIQIFNKNLIEEGYIDLGSYIRSPFLYKCCWSELYSKTFEFEIPSENNWLTYNQINDKLTDKVLIHRKHGNRINENFPIDLIHKEYGDKLIFVSSSENEYKNFKLYNKIEFLKMVTLEDWFTSINSCQMFIGNLTGPTTISNALDKLRIVELPHTIDIYHTIGEEKYSKKIFWYLNDNIKNL